MKFVLSFTNCATANWIIGLFPALCQGKPPGKGKQSNGMFGSTAGDIQEQSWDRQDPMTPPGTSWSQPSDQEVDLSSFELKRGKFPDFRITAGESLVKSIKCQNAPNLLQQQSAKVSPFLQNSCEWFVSRFSLRVLHPREKAPYVAILPQYFLV